MPWQMPIQNAWQLHLVHQPQEHYKVIDALGCYRQFFFHAPQYARKFLFCLVHYANGEFSSIPLEGYLYLTHPFKFRDDSCVSLAPLEGEEHEVRNMRGLLVHHTRASSLRVGAAMDHQIEGPEGMTIEAESTPNVVRVSVSAQLRPGERLRIIKFLAYGWSSQRSRSAIHDQVIAALSAARSTGWEGLLAEQRDYLKNFWKSASIESEADRAILQALRFALFHVLQAGCRGERRPIPAKGLTGPGYDGHACWDTEIFVLHVLTLTLPRAADDTLRWL